MFRVRSNANTDSRTRPLLRIRYADEWVGMLVVATFGLFIFAIIEAGVLRDWLTPSGKLHFNLPESGIAGLAVGNDIELMGIRIGSIRAVKINPHGNMYAIADIDPQFEPYIRKDSRAIIRHRFVVAGASYIELERSKGPAMDWEFAELEATVEPNPADMITKTISDIRAGMMPSLHNADKIMADLAAVTTSIRNGKGTVGGLMMDDTLLKHADEVIRTLQDSIAQLKPIEAQISGVLKQTQGTMDNLRSSSNDVKKATPQLKDTMAHLNDASAQLPALLTQAQATTISLKRLTDQLRSLWILGGSSGKAPARRLPAGDIKP
ncbi:MlaD family protein [Asaia bogorensis]|uniref:MlaD family protein n=1 Tax=Asaia bogorensis TaxID=91915 RepID=UPI002854B82F|nr:MlaD family protein [Asaia bogorensis]MDR6181537.1 phospholipid/cholesterol/gamma-HCH transport system substrate-binding protein [Asaia bogorensis NBRC 16594]